jgi:hypothetical protein
LARVTSALIAILVLAGVMAATVIVALIVMRRVGVRAEGRADDLRAEVEGLGEEWVVPLGGATHQGTIRPSARGQGAGVLGLTERRVVFLPIAGEQLSVPVVRVAAARVEDRRRDTAAAHRHRLVIVLDDGAEHAFLVDDAGEWARGLARLEVPVSRD